MSTAYTMKWRHAIPADAKAEPCPFCGAVQDVIVVFSPYENHGPYWVECWQCHAQGSEARRPPCANPVERFAGVNEAIALWNTRTPSKLGIGGPRDLAVALAVCAWYESADRHMDGNTLREIIAKVDDSLGGDDRASDGEQKAEAGNLAPASPVVHPTPPSYPTIAFDDPRIKEWAKDLGPAIVTAQEARINALEEAAKICERVRGSSILPNGSLREAARQIRATK